MKENENWYVLQVISGKEEKVLEFFSKIKLKDLLPFLPKKKLKIKSKGKARDVLKPLYPGYIFVTGSWDLKEAKEILKIPGAVKFIGGLVSPGKLTKEEKELIKKITKTGGVAEFSKVINEGSKIKIISGPLKELEGEIISVDRRKQKAIVKVPLLNSLVKVSLGFEFIDVKENDNKNAS